MKNKAFTLIELLVVVLIIGVLAAIALPQYERAVEKSRMAEAKIVLKSIIEAESRYGLSIGENTGNFENLDIVVPGSCTPTKCVTKNFTYQFDDGDCGDGCSNPGNGVRFCAARNEKNYSVCLSGTEYDGGTELQRKGHFWCGSSEADCKAAGAIKLSDEQYYFE